MDGGMKTLQKIWPGGILFLLVVSLRQSETFGQLDVNLTTRHEPSLDFPLRNSTLLRKSNQEVDNVSLTALNNDGERKMPFHFNKTESIANKTDSDNTSAIKVAKEHYNKVITNDTDVKQLDEPSKKHLFERLISNSQKFNSNSEFNSKDDYEEINENVDDTKEPTTTTTTTTTTSKPLSANGTADVNDGELTSLANDTNVNFNGAKKETGDDVLINKSLKVLKNNLTKVFPKSQIEIFKNLTLSSSSSKVIEMEDSLKDDKLNETMNETEKSSSIVNLDEKKSNDDGNKKNLLLKFDKKVNSTKINSLIPKGRTISLIADEFNSNEQLIDPTKENFEIKFPKIEQSLANTKDFIEPKESTNEIIFQDNNLMITESSNAIHENLLGNHLNVSTINDTNSLDLLNIINFQNKTIDSDVKDDFTEFSNNNATLIKNENHNFTSSTNVLNNTTDNSTSSSIINSTNIDKQSSIENSLLKVSTLNLSDGEKNETKTTTTTSEILTTTLSTSISNLSTLKPDITTSSSSPPPPPPSTSSSTLVFDKTSLSTTTDDKIDKTTLMPEVTTLTISQTYPITDVSSSTWNNSSEQDIDLETTTLSSTVQYDFVGITDETFDNDYINNNLTSENPLNNISSTTMNQLDNETLINNNPTSTEINLDVESTSTSDIDGFDTTEFNVSEELASTTEKDLTSLTSTISPGFDESTTALFEDSTSIIYSSNNNINNSSSELTPTTTKLSTIESNTEFMLNHSTTTDTSNNSNTNVNNFIYTSTNIMDANETTTVTTTTTVRTTTVSNETKIPSTIINNIEDTTTTVIVQRFSPEDVHLPLRITVEGTWNDICPYLFALRDSLAELLRNGIKKAVSSEQIVFKKNICLDKNYLKDALQSTYTDIYLCVVDENGNYDDTMTRILPTLYSNDKSNFNTSIMIISFQFQEVDNSNNVIAVVVISCIALICLVLLASLLFIMRKRQKRFNYGERCRPVSLDAYSLDSVSAYNSVRRKEITRTSKHSYGNPTFEDSSAVPSHPLNFAALTAFCNDKPAIYEEFSNIPQVSGRIDELPPGAEIKNRYANVIPLPETRVPLMKIDNNPLSEYINANYVRGPKNATKYYIACQAPIESTVSDFWRMIWEQQSKVIIMLTDLIENGVEKCAEYLPPSEVTDCHRVYGNYQITLKKCETKGKYMISTLQLKNLENNNCREVSHIWYLWPNNQSQMDAAGVIAILLEARALQRGGPGSIVVHCSPGTGRTGTLIALDLGIRQYEIIRTVDIPRVVYTIRRDRAGAVQTKEQYAFIYEALNLYATKLAGGSLESI